MLRTIHQRSKPLSISALQRSLLSNVAAGPSTKTSAILTRLPDSVNAAALQNALKDVPNARKIELQPGCSMHFIEQADAEKVASFLRTSNYQASISGATLPSVELKNLPLSSTASVLLEGFGEHRPLTARLFNFDGAPEQPSNRVVATIRCKNQGSVFPSASSVFKQSLLNNPAVKISEPMYLNKPAIFVRNVKHLTEAKVRTLFEKYPKTYLHFVRPSEDGDIDLAIAHFASEEGAFQALNELRDITVDGKRLSLAYREIAQNAVIVQNLPVNFSKRDALAVLPNNRLLGVTIQKINEQQTEAVLVFEDERAAHIATAAINKLTVADKQLSSQAAQYRDVAFQVTFDASQPLTADDIQKELHTAPLAISLSTDLKSLVGFKTIDDARLALSALQNGKVSVGGEGVLSKLAVLPSYVVEVEGLDTATPVSAVLDSLKQNDIGTMPVKTDRNAIVKFKRHSDLVPGLKALKGIEIDGHKMKAERYIPLAIDFQSAYDSSVTGFDEKFDELSTKTLLKDSLGTDPATRYQIVRNAFERALSDAKASKNIEDFIGGGDLLSAKAKEEVANIFKSRNISPDQERKLFEYFVQRQDMLQFTKDFKEFETLFGAPNTSDPFDWSQFRMESNDDAVELYLKAKELGEAAMKKQSATLLGEKESVKLAEGEVHIGDGIVLKNSPTTDGAKTLESPTMLRDKDGRLWSGAILDTDMVQKTMPGQRVGTHRALVVVGNQRGSAGYGMGKGKTSGDAINSAFRNALRNLVHIDLYENYGLAHDLHGKHNSCHAYIRATPRSRLMVASDFASAILLRFGIGSASVKLVGRRDPYSMVQAMFNAISKHQNIDEFAKARGKRYLTLKWAQDNGL